MIISFLFIFKYLIITVGSVCDLLWHIEHLLQIAPKGSFYLFSFTGSPANGSTYSFMFNLSARISSCILFCIYASIFLHFSLLYLHNIPYTRNIYFHICTSNLHVGRISSMNFFPSNILLSMQHYTYARSLPAYVLVLCSIRLLLFSVLFLHIVVSVTYRYLVLSDHI